MSVLESDVPVRQDRSYCPMLLCSPPLDKRPKERDLPTSDYVMYKGLHVNMELRYMYRA